MRDPRKVFEDTLTALGAKNEKIVAVSCDSCSGGGLSAFFKAYPKRSVEVGISEQNAVSLCAAMSKQGFIPVLVVIDPFLTMRAYEQVRDDLGYSHTNVKIVASGGGLAYSTLGSTHMAVEDVAVMRTIPNLTIFCPGDADEVEFYLEQALAIDGPVFLRMPRQARPAPLALEMRNMAPYKTELLTRGNGDAVLFTYGPSVDEAMKAVDLLKEKGIGLTVVNCTTVKPLDEAAILAYTKGAKAAYVLEEHAPTGGLGSAVAEILAHYGVGVPLHVFAVPEGAKMTGPYDELLDYHGLSGSMVAERILASFIRG
ncbi:MAG: transketolase [Clostridia bacterium]|nr:transketolase [Clostridia bacterium]